MRHHTMRKLPPLLPPASQYFADAISYQIAANEEVLVTTDIPGLGSCQFDAVATILAATGVRMCSGDQLRMEMVAKVRAEEEVWWQRLKPKFVQRGIESAKDEFDGWVKKIEGGDWGDSSSLWILEEMVGWKIAVVLDGGPGWVRRLEWANPHNEVAARSGEGIKEKVGCLKLEGGHHEVVFERSVVQGSIERSAVQGSAEESAVQGSAEESAVQGSTGGFKDGEGADFGAASPSSPLPPAALPSRPSASPSHPAASPSRPSESPSRPAASSVASPSSRPPPPVDKPLPLLPGEPRSSLEVDELLAAARLASQPPSFPSSPSSTSAAVAPPQAKTTKPKTRWSMSRMLSNLSLRAPFRRHRHESGEEDEEEGGAKRRRVGEGEKGGQGSRGELLREELFNNNASINGEILTILHSRPRRSAGLKVLTALLAAPMIIIMEKWASGEQAKEAVDEGAVTQATIDAKILTIQAQRGQQGSAAFTNRELSFTLDAISSGAPSGTGMYLARLAIRQRRS